MTQALTHTRPHTPAATYDGEPAANDLPKGAAVVVWRRQGHELEVLILHRAHHGADFKGDSPDQEDWAWTPPSGARRPGEYVGFTAQRKLREETGLDLKLTLSEAGAADWRVFTAEAPAGAMVRLDAEHDRHAWVPLDQALLRCLPPRVADQLRVALVAAA
jgi:8-oxo-dGTP pyrophosphatase MutT (NUDIX family)